MSARQHAIRDPGIEPSLNVPETRKQAEEIIQQWPCLAKTTAGGLLTDTIGDILRKREAAEK